jgi:hypothetical protein
MGEVGFSSPGCEGWNDEVLCEFEAAGFAGAGYGVCGGSDGANDNDDDDGGAGCEYDGWGSGRSDGSDGGAYDNDDGDAGGGGDAVRGSDAGRSGRADDGDDASGGHDEQGRVEGPAQATEAG